MRGERKQERKEALHGGKPKRGFRGSHSESRSGLGTLQTSKAAAAVDTEYDFGSGPHSSLRKKVC